MKHKEVATKFMQGLDEELYSDVLKCLSLDCKYEIAGEIHVGPEAIVDSYRGNGDWAKENIDKISYGSALINVEGLKATVVFSDYLEHAGQKLAHHCHQHLEFDSTGLICNISHEDLPGEKDSLKAFFVTVGLKKSTD